MSILLDKHAVVTGGARGIGLAIARALKGQGALVSVLSRTVPDTGDGFARAAADVTDETSLVRALDEVCRVHGSVSILVNNAGIAESAPFKRTDRAMWDRIIGTNLTGTYLCSRLLLEPMLAAKWGRIINIASIAGLYGAPYISAYSASKHGVMGLTRSLASELAGSGVTANVICPGYTESDMMQQAVANIMKRTGMPAERAREELARTNPGGRIVTASEVAAAAIALLESEANGKEIVLPAV